jgi:hypothetical protein
MHIFDPNGELHKRQQERYYRDSIRTISFSMGVVLFLLGLAYAVTLH